MLETSIRHRGGGCDAWDLTRRDGNSEFRRREFVGETVGFDLLAQAPHLSCDKFLNFYERFNNYTWFSH